MKTFKFYLMFSIMMITIVTFSVFLVVNAPWLYYLNLKFLNLGAQTGMAHAQLMHTYIQILKFLQIPWDVHLNLIYFKSSFKGIKHFHDVKNLILLNHFLLLVTGSVSIPYYWHLHKNKMTWQLIQPCQEVLLLILVLLFLLVLDFNDLFIIFHKFLFHNQDWIFNSKFDPIIQVLPNSLFFQLFILFFLIVVISLLTIILMAKRSLKFIS